MTQNNQWLKYLDVYGCDITRWPETPNSSEIKLIMTMPEYMLLHEVENELFKVDWPTPSKQLKASTLHAIRQQSMAEVLVLNEYAKKGLWFQVVCFVICLGLGLTLGGHFTDQGIRHADYNYFSVGAAYGY